MFSHLKESTSVLASGIKVFCTFFFFGVVALSDWLKGFALINQWIFVFLIPKILVIAIGYLVTPFPLWFLVPLSFLPIRILLPIFFLAFIFALARF